MKTYLEKIQPHPENPELSVIFKAMEDDVDPSTLSDSYMEESVSDEIQLKFFSGNKAAWFTAHVKVCNKGDEENLQHGFGEDFLGGCNYHSFEDFLGSEQYKDMVKEATNELVKNKETIASAPSWHELTEHAIVFGTEEQFKMAQDFDAEYNEEPIFLPCIIEDQGYAPGEQYPEYSTSKCDDGSYEDMVENGELNPEEIDRDTFLMDCLKSVLEELWSPDLSSSQATASTPSWHADDQGNEIYGTELQVDAWATISDSGGICKLPMIYGGVGYNGGSDEPNFELANFADLAKSEEEQLQAMREALEKSYNPTAYTEVEGTWVDQDELGGKYHLSKLVPGFDPEKVQHDDAGFGKLLSAGDVVEIRNMTTEDKEKVIVEDFNGLEFQTDGGGKPDTSHYTKLGKGGGYYVDSDKVFYICFNKEPAIQVTKVGVATADFASWEEITPEVWVFGTSKQVECAIQDGDLPCELPCIVGDKGYKPLSENPDCELGDFLADFGQSADESKMGQMRQALEQSYNASAYSNVTEHEAEEMEVLRDFNENSEADVNKKFSLLTNEDATGKNLKANFLKNLTKNLNDYHKLYGQEALEQSLEKLCLDFASNNGVTFEDKGDTLLFIQKGLEGYAKQPKIDEAISGKKTIASDKCLTHSFSDVEIEDTNGETQVYEVEVEQCFDFEHGYGEDRDGNRGQNTWFFSDMSILSIQDENGKYVDLKTKEGMELKNKIESDKWFTKTVENHDWDVSSAAASKKLPSHIKSIKTKSRTVGPSSDPYHQEALTVEFTNGKKAIIDQGLSDSITIDGKEMTPQDFYEELGYSNSVPMDGYDKARDLMVKKFEEHVKMDMSDVYDWAHSHPVDPYGPPN